MKITKRQLRKIIREASWLAAPGYDWDSDPEGRRDAFPPEIGEEGWEEDQYSQGYDAALEYLKELEFSPSAKPYRHPDRSEEWNEGFDDGLVIGGDREDLLYGGNN